MPKLCQQNKKPLFKGFIYYMAGVAGIEPASVVLETIILPLYYTPICTASNILPYFQ